MKFIDKIKGSWIGLLPLLLCGCEVSLVIPNPPPRTQPIVDPYAEYNYTPTAGKVLLLNEEFTNNSRGWRVVSNASQYSIRIVGGELEMSTRDNLQQQNTISLSDLKSTDNFEMEARIRVQYTSGADMGHGNILLWGAATTGSSSLPVKWLYYGINDDDRALSIGAYNGQTYDPSESFLTTQSEAAYYKSDYNTLTLRQVNNTCYYFLNGELLTKKDAMPFYGSRLGFGVDRYSTVFVDYLKVSRLNVK